jgi:ABC-2 type transport system permease protein
VSARRLRTLVRREVLATFRDPFTVTILIAVPLLALLLFGYIMSTEVRHLGLAVHDGDHSRTSRRIVAELTAGGTFDAREVARRSDIERALVSGEVSAAIVFPAGFERSLERARTGGERAEIQLDYDGTEAVLAGNAEAFLRAMIASAVAEPGAARPGVQIITHALFNPKLAGEPFMVAGTFGFVLSFLTTLITAVSIVNERQAGTFEQLQVTPATSAEILLGKLLPLGAIFALDVFLMALVGGFLLGVWPRGSLVFFVVISAVYVLVSLATGLIFSATSGTAAEAVQKTVLFSVPLVQLSGFIFPVRNMPVGVGWLAELFPATHYIRLSRAIYLRGEGPLQLLPEIGVILLFGVAMLAYALRSLEERG